MHCHYCRFSLDNSSVTCPSCGAPIPRDLMALQAEQKAKNERRAKLQEKRDRIASQPRSILRNTGSWLLLFVFMAAFAWLLVGYPIHMLVTHTTQWSPVSVVCPWHCKGCRSSGRVFSWNFKGNWHENKGKMGYAFVCAGPGVNPNQLTVADIAKRNDELQPFMIHGFVVFALEGVFFTIAAGFLMTLIWVPGHRRRLDRALAKVQAELASLG